MTPSPASQYTEDYNLIYGSRQGSTGLQGSHTTFATPTFLNPTATNYQLAPGSPGSGNANPNVAPRSPAKPSIGILPGPDLAGAQNTAAGEGRARRPAPVRYAAAFGAFRRRDPYICPAETNPARPYMCLAGLKGPSRACVWTARRPSRIG